MSTLSTQVNITIDGKQCRVEPGVTILEAARQNGISIPTLCHHEALTAWGGCRLCVVEVDGSPRLSASCVTPVRDGMNVVTRNDRIIESRRTILEFLFAERNHNCMICPQSGDCELQALAYELGMEHVSVPFSFQDFPTDITSDHIGVDHSRCILCGRCVRACREIAGAGVLGFHNRGSRTLVGLDLLENREDSSCQGCGVCLQVCPTGAIYNRHRTHYRVKGHDAAAAVVETACTLCGLACPTRVHVRDGQVLKVEGMLMQNGHRPDCGQLCSRGRFEILLDPGPRLRTSLQRGAAGGWQTVSWEDALQAAATRLMNIKKQKGKEALFGLTSSTASNEELMLFTEMVRGGWSADIDTFDGDQLRGITRLLQHNNRNHTEAHWSRIIDADAILVIGSDPGDSQPLITSLIRRRQMEAGVFVGVVGPQIHSLPLTDHQLSLPPGDLQAAVRVMSAAVVAAAGKSAKHGRSSPENGRKSTRELPDMDAAKRKLATEITNAYIAAKHPLVVIGDAVLQDSQTAAAVHEILRIGQKNASDEPNLIILKKSGNSAAARILGLSSGSSLLSGRKHLGGVVLLSGSEDLDSGFFNFLNGLSCLVVFSPYFPDKIADKADLLIPIPSVMETEGSYLSLDGGSSFYRPKALPPPEGVHPVWETLCRLMELTGCASKTATWKDIRTKAQEACRAS